MPPVERLPRIRRAPIPPDAVLVVRGDELLDDVLLDDVLNFFRLADLEAAGITVVDTFRTPHVTLAHPDVDELVMLLQGCPNETVSNPYNED